MSDTLLHLVERFGYAVIAALILAEGVGLPLPGEASLVVGAALAATTRRLTLSGVIIAAAAGAIAGAAGGYWLGASVSDARLARWAARLGISPARLQRAQDLVRAHGARTALVSRFVTVLRMLLALVAGASRMSFWEFMAFSSLGAAIWAMVYGSLGYVFGDRLPWLQQVLGRTTLIATLLLLFLGASYWLVRRSRRGSAAP